MLEPLHHSPIGAPHTWEPMRHNSGNQATGGVWRVTGPGGTAILKHAVPGTDPASPWAASDIPDHWNYWRREYLAYTTGATDAYVDGTGLTAPKLLAAGERGDGTLELWLEHLDGDLGPTWSLDRLTDFALRLGQAQAQWAHTRPEPWHSRRFLRQYTTKRDFPAIAWDHPVAARHWPEPLRRDLRALWARRTDLYAVAETAPQTICHLDVWPMNLISRGETAALLDWSFTGQGAIGEDIGNLIPDTFFDGLTDLDLLGEAEAALPEAYLAGLADAGSTADTDRVRRSIAAAGAAKYVWLAPAILARLQAGDRAAATMYDPDSDEATVFARNRRIFTMLVSWAHTALDT